MISFIAFYGLYKKHISLDEIDIAEEGFDPSTFGLWAQHASAATLRC